MTDALPLLIEIGTEELPPTSLTTLERAFGQLVGEALLIEGFEHDGLQTFATPRRLAIVINSIATTQPDQTIERRGPALTA
ncbi:MAG: glycine--tRNA ligase subunit beta, partial [Pseudomonadales bacterium]